MIPNLIVSDLYYIKNLSLLFGPAGVFDLYHVQVSSHISIFFHYKQLSFDSFHCLAHMSQPKIQPFHANIIMLVFDMDEDIVHVSSMSIPIHV